MREERRLRLFENRLLRRTYGPKRDEVIGERRKLHKEELNDPYSSPSIVQGDKIEKNEMGGACSAYGVEETCIGFGGENCGKETIWKTQA